ncbi:MAG: glycosyltransferase family 2 protein [Aristaeellaceae bacterium]
MLYLIIPVYNVQAYLARCVESVLCQRAQFQMILVDDGSTDGSGALCDEYASRHPDRIAVIHKPNGGLSSARNAGLAQCFALSQDASRDYAMMLDSDDFLREGCLETLMALCGETGCDGVQFGWEHGPNSQFTIPLPEQPVLRHMTGAQALLEHSVKTAFGNKVYRLSLYEGEWFPEGKLNEDEFLFYRIVWKCRSFVTTSAVYMYYYHRDGSIMHTLANRLKGNPHRNDWREAFDERIRFFEERGEARQVQRCYERICIELILRYSEQMQLPREQRDTDVTDGTMVRDFRRFYPRMIGLDTIRPARKLVFTLFYLCPWGAAVAGRIHSLRR